VKARYANHVTDWCPLCGFNSLLSLLIVRISRLRKKARTIKDKPPAKEARAIKSKPPAKKVRATKDKPPAGKARATKEESLARKHVLRAKQKQLSPRAHTAA